MSIVGPALVGIGRREASATSSAVRARNERRCDRILQRAAPLQTADLDWESVPAYEIEPEALACLVYMRDVEGFTDRDLVGLTAHPTTLGDPLLNRFLGLWRAEESEHARCLGDFLDRYGDGRGQPIPPRQAPPAAVATGMENIISRMRGPVGHVVSTAHMAWGAANELLTLNGYRLLAARCGHPVLAELLSRIADQEARHYSFYLPQAEWRLGVSRLARIGLARVLSRSWTPVGVGDGYKSPQEFGRVAAYLSSSPSGTDLVDRMDQRFSRLPGFDGLRIYRQALDHHSRLRSTAGA